MNNAIESCQRYAAGVPVCVVDDNSDDPETRTVLANLPDGVTLFQPPPQEENRHGGLYDNMQLALERVDSEWLLFLQDDMQLVRPLAPDDEAYIEAFFDAFEEKAFLNPVFLKGQRSRRDQRITRVFDNFPGYYRNYPEKSNPRGLCYADVVIGHTQRLKARGWRFSRSEQDNAHQAQRHFGLMGFMAHPFVMFLPQVPVYRGKTKTWAVATAERWSGREPKRFLERPPEHWRQFKARPLSELPVAETYLQCEDRDVKTPYQYSAVNAYWPLRALHKLTLMLKG
ncbi:glycosyltransferase [Ferrimonas balearica]|nr:glycosyltransferase [Ferrimonas balearica]